MDVSELAYIEKLELQLPESDKDGFAIDGQVPVISLSNGVIGLDLPLIDICKETIMDNPNENTASVLAEWLRAIADDLMINSK